MDTVEGEEEEVAGVVDDIFLLSFPLLSFYDYDGYQLER